MVSIMQHDRGVTNKKWNPQMRNFPAVSSNQSIFKAMVMVFDEPNEMQCARSRRDARWAAFWRALIALYNGVWSKR